MRWKGALEALIKCEGGDLEECLCTWKIVIPLCAYQKGNL
jgi:hypothetical protein